MRNLPLLKSHFEKNNAVPIYMATCFAAYLLYMRVKKKTGNKYFGKRNNELYEIKDAFAEYFYQLWTNKAANEIAELVMQNEELWEYNLTAFPGFLGTVQEKLSNMINNGVMETILRLEEKKVAF